ncbi:hypothetical protein CCS01_21890 [Rhodopila globiformis]|uniref:Uncharacterized protein n=1 Tax=Rhodopila globiformis TaxID=1071 RepID=A0A2S6N3Y9_RHOGL|nr:hypothetical protein CCS01_21890 [Rhodopila globiformis]
MGGGVADGGAYLASPVPFRLPVFNTEKSEGHKGHREDPFALRAKRTTTGTAAPGIAAWPDR